MWWPRPRWKCDLFTYCTLLLFVTITTTSDAVMADEGQHCGGANMSAVVWTTALCTMLLVLMVVAIYFIYCRRRENDWSSLWWKSNSDKNLVLQTSLPEKDLQQQKVGGTDNPAFLADTYVGDRVTSTGLTKIVRLPQLTLNDGSLEIELSTKEDDNQTYMCKHSDGSKDRLVALRLVFDKGQQQQQQQQQQCGSPSDLSRALVELSRKYGFQVELETDGVAAVAQPTVAGEKSDEAVKCAKPSLLSAVRGKAQRLWHQGQVVFKGGDRVDADNKNGDGDLESAESGRADAVASSTQKSSCTAVTTIDETTTAVQQATATRNGNGSLRYRTLEYGASPADAAAYSSPDSSVQYCSVNVPEPAAVASVSAVMAAAAVMNTEVATASDQDAIVTVSGKDATSTVSDQQDATETPSDKYNVVTVTASDKHAVVGDDDDEKISATKPKHTAPAKPNRDEPKQHAAPDKPNRDEPKQHAAPDKPNRDEPKHTAPAKPNGDEPKHTAPAKPNRDEPKHTAPAKPDRDEPKTTTPVKPNHVEPTKHTAANPPPPPPRKYSAPVVPAVVTVPHSTAPIATVTATVIAADTADTGALQRSPTVLDESPALPTKGPPQVMSEIKMDDDYYWCTTTSMAPPPMLTFGKKPPVTGSTAETTNRNGYAAAPSATVDEKSATVDEKNTTVDEKNVTVDEKNATVDERYAAVVTADDVVRDVIVSAGTTTSIEDASLPSFSSDEDEDDDENGVFADNKAKFPANTTDAVEQQNGSGDKACNGEVIVNSGCKDNAVAKADCDAGPAAVESKSPTRLPTLRLSLSSPLSSTATTSCCSSSASSTSSTSTSSSPTNNGSSNNNSPIVSKIPVRRQSAGSSIGTAVVSSPMANGTAKKSIPLPLSRSGSRLAMWSSAN